MRIFLFIAFIIISNYSQAQSTGCDSTFIQTFGTTNYNERGYSLVDGKDGHIYLGGSQAGEIVILKLTNLGKLVWSKKIFSNDGTIKLLSQIILDSDGHLTGCGFLGDALSGGIPFVFRINLSTQSIIWYSQINMSGTFIRGLVEIGIGKNFLLLSDSQAPNNMELIEIDRVSGNIANLGIMNTFDLGAADTFNEGVVKDGFLYLCGRYTDGGGFDNMRTGLSKIKLPEYVLEWSVISHVQSFNTARLYAQDLVIDDNTIITISSGDDDGSGLSNTNFFLQKTDLDGKVIWIKKYDATGIANEFIEEIVNLPDGFLLYGRTSFTAPSNLIVIKLSKNGDVIWGKSIDFQYFDNFNQVASGQAKAIVINEHYYFTAYTKSSSAGNEDILFFKLNRSGEIKDSCANVVSDINVQVSPVFNPTVNKVFLKQTSSVIGKSNPLTSFDNIDTLDSKIICDCFKCPTIHKTDTVYICKGDTFEGYSESGEYFKKIILPNGCDSIRKLVLKVNNNSNTQLNPILCKGEKYKSYDKTGVYIEKNLNKYGCDSIVTINLTINEGTTVQNTKTICNGDIWKGRSKPGIYIDTLKNSIGCDSIIITILNIEEKYYKDTVFVDLCDEDNFRGKTIRKIVIDTIKAKNYCDTIRVFVINTNSMYIPNVFSPNDDGVNDFFHVFFNEMTDIKVKFFAIFDRFGNQVYELSGLNEISWDGKYRGQALNPGVFTYALKYECGGSTKVLGGSVTLVR